MKIFNILGWSFVVAIILGGVIGTAVQFATHNILGITCFCLSWGLFLGIHLGHWGERRSR